MNIEKPSFKKICLMHLQALTNFPYIEKDFDAITDYELLCKVVDYLNKVIKNENEQNETIMSLYKAFVELKDYVDSYFENLDVQDEINNKLDEMAESGELTQLILNYIYQDIKIAFPSYKIEGTNTLGDCSIIKSQNKSLMIDCFDNNDNCYIGIQETLYHLGIAKLDYLLITHYHADHYGNIYRLINDGYLDNATVILPRDCTRYPNNNGNAIKSALTAAGIKFELCDNQTFYLDDVKVSLFNGNETDYAYYDSYDGKPALEYNDYSIYANVEYRGKRILFTGDGDYVSNAYVTPRYLLTGYDLLKDNHHGFIKFNPDYVKKVIPKKVVIPATIGMVNLNLSRWAVESGYWQLDTPDIYLQGYQQEELIFGLKVDSIQCISDGYSVQGYAGNGSWHYYIDSTTTNLIRTGSRENPFKTLMEAVALVPKRVNYQIVLNCINLSADSYDINFRGFNVLKINFNNLEFNHKMNFIHCNNLFLDDINTTKPITIDASRCVITDMTSAVTDETYNLFVTNSNLTINGTVDVTGYTNEGFRIGRNCYVDMNITSFDSEISTGHLFNSWGSTINFTDECIDVLKNYKFITQLTNAGSVRGTSYSNNVAELMTLFESDTPEYSQVVCSENLSNYDEIEITSKTSDNFVRVDRYNNKGYHSFVDCYTNAENSEAYMKCARFSFVDNNVNIARTGNITLKADPVVGPGTNPVGIIKVRGIIK